MRCVPAPIYRQIIIINKSVCKIHGPKLYLDAHVFDLNIEILNALRCGDDDDEECVKDMWKCDLKTFLHTHILTCVYFVVLYTFMIFVCVVVISLLSMCIVYVCKESIRWVFNVAMQKQQPVNIHLVRSHRSLHHIVFGWFDIASVRFCLEMVLLIASAWTRRTVVYLF